MRNFWFAAMGLAGTFGLFAFTSLDLQVQDQFYSFSRQQWLIQKEDLFLRFWFYLLPKYLLILFGVYLLTCLVLPYRFFPWRIFAKREALFLALSLSLVPAVIGLTKNISGIHCPSQLRRYGGKHEYRPVFNPNSEVISQEGTEGTESEGVADKAFAGLSLRSFSGQVLRSVDSVCSCSRLVSVFGFNRARPLPGEKSGRCFPAGHASGGFALLSLYYVFNQRKIKRLGFGIGLLAGWAMGLYQMLKGAHFLSHTLVTMFVAWGMIQLLALVCKVPPRVENLLRNGKP